MTATAIVMAYQMATGMNPRVVRGFLLATRRGCANAAQRTQSSTAHDATAGTAPSGAVASRPMHRIASKKSTQQTKNPKKAKREAPKTDSTSERCPGRIQIRSAIDGASVSRRARTPVGRRKSSGPGVRPSRKVAKT